MSQLMLPHYLINQKRVNKILYCCRCSKPLEPNDPTPTDLAQSIYICKLCRNIRASIIHKRLRRRRRLDCLKKIDSRLCCIRCGCDDLRFIEINHKNGDGRNERNRLGTAFHSDIVFGRRKIDDLELLCKPCNHIHYLELKYGEQIPLKVIWKAGISDVEEEKK